MASAAAAKRPPEIDFRGTAGSNFREPSRQNHRTKRNNIIKLVALAAISAVAILAVFSPIAAVVVGSALVIGAIASVVILIKKQMNAEMADKQAAKQERMREAMLKTNVSKKGTIPAIIAGIDSKKNPELKAAAVTIEKIEKELDILTKKLKTADTNGLGSKYNQRWVQETYKLNQLNEAITAYQYLEKQADL